MKRSKKDIEEVNEYINSIELEEVDIVIKKDGYSNVKSIKYVNSQGLLCHYTGDVAKFLINAIKDADQ